MFINDKAKSFFLILNLEFLVNVQQNFWKLDIKGKMLCPKGFPWARETIRDLKLGMPARHFDLR